MSIAHIKLDLICALGYTNQNSWFTCGINTIEWSPALIIDAAWNASASANSSNNKSIIIWIITGFVDNYKYLIIWDSILIYNTFLTPASD